MAQNFDNRNDGMDELARLLARDRERNAPEDMAVSRPPGIPDVGILSRTLIQSCMTKWILPARLRNGDNRELLFVGENYIHIKEVVPDASVDFRLRHRQTLPYIESSIKAVALLGYTDVLSSKEDESKLPSLSETMANIEQPKAERRDYPIQILVVALESGWLQLLTPDHDAQADGQYIKFKCKRIALPVLGAPAITPNARITADPSSRAFAVAAPFDYIVVYNNHDRGMLSASIKANKDNWNPIHEERLINVPGRIVGVEFLHPGDKPNDVVLLIISAQGRQSFMTCYTWIHGEGPNNRRTILDRQPLVAETGSLCNMVIPMANSPDFLLIHGDTVDLYSNVLSGRPDMFNIANKESNWDAEPSFPANSKCRPQFTAWARPARTPGFKEEFIFFIREDGVVRHYHRHSTRSVPCGEIGNSGVLDCHVNTAFASFCPSSRLPDYIIAAGDMSDGEFHSVGVNQVRHPEAQDEKKDAVMGLVKLKGLPDWSPVMDMQIIQEHNQSTRPSLMVTNGRQPFGAFSEPRIGHEGELTYVLYLEEDLVGCNGMWLLRESDKLAHCICSYPDSSLVHTISSDWKVGESGISIYREEETKFAGVLKDCDGSGKPVVCVVTANFVTLQYFGLDEAERIKPIQDDICVAFGRYTYLFLASRISHDQSRIQVYQVEGKTLRLRTEVFIVAEVTALQYHVYGGKEYMIVASSDGESFGSSVLNYVPLRD